MLINDLINNNAFITSTQMIVDKVKEEHEVDVTVRYVQQQIHALGLKYKKLKHISMQGNSERALVLRQRWAMKYLDQDLQFKNILNLDETWLGMSDFRRHHWRPYKEKCCGGTIISSVTDTYAPLFGQHSPNF